MVAIVAIVAAGAVLSPTPGIADVHFCNQVHEPVAIAFGYRDPKRGWVSEGWWEIGVGSCRQIWRGRMANRIYYVFAFSPTRRWGAPAGQNAGYFCISRPNAFKLEMRRYSKNNKTDCENHGYESVQFRELRQTHAVMRHNIENGGPPTASPQPAPSPSPAPPPAPPPASTPSTPSTTPGGTACERFPNLC